MGDEISFAGDAGGALRAELNGARLPGAELRSPLLIRALFEVYAGEGAVSARAVNTLRANLSRVCEEEGGLQPGAVERLVAAEHQARLK